MKIFNNDKFFILKNKEHIEVYRFEDSNDRSSVIFEGSYDSLKEAEEELEIL